MARSFLRLTDPASANYCLLMSPIPLHLAIHSRQNFLSISFPMRFSLSPFQCEEIQNVNSTMKEQFGSRSRSLKISNSFIFLKTIDKSWEELTIIWCVSGAEIPICLLLRGGDEWLQREARGTGGDVRDSDASSRYNSWNGRFTAQLGNSWVEGRSATFWVWYHSSWGMIFEVLCSFHFQQLCNVIPFFFFLSFSSIWIRKGQMIVGLLFKNP